MYVCICLGISDKKIVSAIDNGATTMKKLTTELNIGSQCGKCCQCAKKILHNERIKHAQELSQVQSQEQSQKQPQVA